MASTLYRNCVVHSPADPFAEALLVADGRVAWIGAEDTVHTVEDGADEVVDLDGALVTPAFVDAHVHVLETGLALTGLDVSVGAGVTSGRALLDALAAAAARHDGTGPLLGHGWDETSWPDAVPTRTELDRAAGGLAVYLSRTDVHSALVTTALAERAGCAGVAGWSLDGPVTQEAHHRARATARDLPAQAREAAHRSALAAMAAQGVVAVHEHSGPSLDSREALASLLAMTAPDDAGLPLVVGYRAEPCSTVAEARALLEAIPGLTGIGGDLCVDGSIGSRTAALREPYADAPGGGASRGVLMLDADQVATHVTAVASAGAQAAFHVIGDRAMDELLAGVARAAEGPDGTRLVRAGGHRVEHAEMLDDAALDALVRLGLSVSAQPAFDAAWGGPTGMYAQRLGAARAQAMNPFAALARAGVPLAFGSDSPVTPVDPWGGVRAAVLHRTEAERISARAAFRAHTRGGWRLAGLDHTGAGEIRLGAPAHLAVWAAETLSVQGPEGRSRWSTDRRAGTPLLPDLTEGSAAPECLRTLRAGNVIHDRL